MLEFCAAGLAAQNFAVAPQLRRHVEALCDEEMEGRRAGSEGERLAAVYLYRSLAEAGVVMLTDSLGQDFTIAADGDSIASRNIVGIVEGADPALREEYIVVGAHLDHLGTHVLTVDGEPVRQVYAGADANASGLAILIELAQFVSEYKGLFPRSVIFVGFGAGEQGEAGAWYFVNRAFEQIRNVRAMVDLNMLGRSGDDAPFRYFTQMEARDADHLFALVREDPVVTWPQPLHRTIPSSDYLPFYERSIPVFLFTSGPSREYRTLRDLPRLLDYGAIEARCQYLYYFLQRLSAEESIPRIGEVDAAAQQRRAEKVYAASECDTRPQFFHSNEKHFLESWVYKYLKYPRAAIENNIQGQVLVSFIVERDGSVTDVRVEHGVDELLDDEAVRVVSVSPKWIPGRIKGEKVRTRIVIPVEFRLSSKWDIRLKK